jgi:two-component system sensor histidine kinase KdpD
MESQIEGEKVGSELKGSSPSVQLVACVSPSPSSSRVVRVAARIAKDLGVGWMALYVETPETDGMSSAERDRLHEHFSLAQRLGGEVITTVGTDVVQEIAHYTRLHNITQVVIGKDSAFRRVPFRFSLDRVQKLLRLRPDLELHVVPMGSGMAEARSSVYRWAVGYDTERPFTAANALKAVFILSAATGIGIGWFALGFKEANIILVFLLAVLLISLFAGRILGLISSVAAVLAFNFFFTEPRGTLMVHDLQYLATFPVMLTVALITSALTGRLRQQARLSAERERRTETLYRTSRGLLKANGRKAVVSVGLAHLRDLLHRDVVCYVPDEDGALHPHELSTGSEGPSMTDHSNGLNAAWTFEHGQFAGCGTATFSESTVYYHPLSVQEQMLGVVVVDCSQGPLGGAESSLLEAVAAQLALALDRERLARIEEEHRVEIERERLRSDLLRSISHDLRTPLAAIAGAGSTLHSAFSGAGSIDTETTCELARGIYDDATWLTRLVENLLSLTRVEGHLLKLTRDWEVAEDLVASALERFRGRLSSHQVRSILPEQPILVQVDPALIEQVLVNLIDNAIRYTPLGSTIEIRTAETDQSVMFEVSDNGPGLSDKALHHAFERFFTETPSQIERRGLGLGLAISKSIVEAHGGSIIAMNREDGGAVFRFFLPREGAPLSGPEEPKDDR